MSEIQLFNFEGHEVRLVGTAQRPEWVAADVCKVLDIQNVRQNLADFDGDEKGVCSVYTPGGNQSMVTVTEPGLYRLIFKSRKPEAKKFQRWVFNEVLPGIRQFGGYVVGMHGRLEVVTPAWAKELLGNQGLNRNVNEARVRFYVKEMESESWENSHQGIAISTEGKLLDGQHRLNAIVRLGKPVKLFVARNVPESAMKTFDRGQMRTLAQSLQISGVSARPCDVSCLRFSTLPISGRGRMRSVSWTDSQLREKVERFLPDLVFANQQHGGAACRTACIRSAVFRAAVCNPDAKPLLKNYLQILDQGLLMSGIEIDAEMASRAICVEALRNIYLKTRGQSSDYAYQADLHRKALASVKAFLEGRCVKIIHPVKKQPFPIPELD